MSSVCPVRANRPRSIEIGHPGTRTANIRAPSFEASAFAAGDVLAPPQVDDLRARLCPMGIDARPFMSVALGDHPTKELPLGRAFGPLRAPRGLRPGPPMTRDGVRASLLSPAAKTATSFPPALSPFGRSASLRVQIGSPALFTWRIPAPHPSGLRRCAPLREKSFLTSVLLGPSMGLALRACAATCRCVKNRS
jgi:hypothetical protein